MGLWSEDLSLFDYKNSRDGYSYRWFQLYKEFQKAGVELVLFNNTCKVDLDNFYAVIENGVRDFKHSRKYLLIVEGRGIRPQDWVLENHAIYRKIFCWNDDLIDNERYFKLNFAFKFPDAIPRIFHQKKLCCMVSANKVALPFSEGELYSKRVDCIRWFERNHPDDFDLYGIGWDQYGFGRSLMGRALNKIKFLRKKNIFPSYRSVVESKYNTMKGYKFSICYENFSGYNGYITEKIFDSFFAGCVPIYWGANNVEKHIPEACFIDIRNFSGLNEVYLYIANMSEERYMEYLNSIEGFLESDRSRPFKAETFAKTIVEEVLEGAKSTT